MSEQFRCPRCTASADRADRFCGGCGLRRPVIPGAVPRPPAPAPPELVLPGLTEPIPGLPVPAVAVPRRAGAPFSLVTPPTPDAPEAPRRGAGSIALSAVGLTFRLVNGLLTIVSGIAIAVIASRNMGEHDAGWFLAGGIGWALYGLYIVVTRRSYWVSSLFTYLIPIVVIVYLASGAGPR